MSQPKVTRNVTVYNYTLGTLENDTIALSGKLRRVQPLTSEERHELRKENKLVIDCTVTNERLCISLQKFLDLSEPSREPFYPGKRDRYGRK